MSDKDGLFENPNLQRDQNINEQQRDTLNEIKEDASSILDALNRFGGRQIELLAQAEKQQSSQQKTDKRFNQELLKAVKAPKAQESRQKREDKARSKNKVNSPQLNQKHTSATSAKPNQTPEEKNTAEKQAVSSSEKSPNKEQSKSQEKDKQEKLPNGWKRDKNGRVRDSKGRFVEGDELAKHGIKNPPKKEKDSAEETEDLARDSALLEALGEIKDAVESPDNLDPIIDGIKEVTGPLGSAWDVGKKVLETTGRGYGKLFSQEKSGFKRDKHGYLRDEKGRFVKDDKRKQRWRDRFFGFFKKFAKTQEKSSEKQTSELKRIEKKVGGKSPGLFSRLFSGLGGLLGGGLGLLGGAARMGGGLLGGLLGGAGKLGKGLFGGAGKLGKGFLKKIPVLGALFALGDGIGGLFDDTRDENGKSNRGKRVGSAAGTAIGGVIGSAFGPVGTIAGAMIGDWLGEKIGAWAADFDWGVITNKISGAWDSSVEWIKSTWNGIDWSGFGAKISSAWDSASNWIKSTWASFDWSDFTAKISSAWDSAKTWITTTWESIDWGSFSKKVSDAWESITAWIKSKWDSIDFSGAWETTKEVAGKVYNTGATVVSGAVGLAKSAASSAKEWVSEKAGAAVDTVKGWFDPSSAETINTNAQTANVNTSTPPTEQPAQQSAVENATVQTDSLEAANSRSDLLRAEREQISLLEKIKNILADTLLMWREWVANDYLRQETPQDGGVVPSNGYPNSTITSQSTPSSFVDTTSGVSLMSGGAVDPLTGKPLRYSQGEFKGGTIDGLSAEETAHAMNALSARESSGNFKVENQYGYMGGYQFGADALSETGFIDKKKWAAFRAANKGKNLYSGGQGNSLHAQFLNDPSNWTIQGGKQAYLNSKEMQDQSAVRLMNNNIRFLKGKGVKFNDSGDIVGAGFAAHLKGAGNALKLLRDGKDSRDANGTSTAYYAQLGKNAMSDTKAFAATKATMNVPATATATTTAVTPPKVGETQGMTIPNINVPTANVEKTVSKVEQETVVEQKDLYKPKEVDGGKNSRAGGGDPIAQFLTQDVSDRRIAHIVTGGIAQKGRM